jgi:hypothetical protein
MSLTTDLATTSVLTPLLWQLVSAIMLRTVIVGTDLIVGPSGQLRGVSTPAPSDSRRTACVKAGNTPNKSPGELMIGKTG